MTEYKPTPQETADVLETAADALTADGWTQGMTHEGVFQTPGKPVPHCAYGALRVALGIDNHDGTYAAPAYARDALTVDETADLDQHIDAVRLSDTWTRLYAALDAMSHHLDRPQGPLVNVADWNDAEGRTQAEVEDAMRGTAKDLRNEARP